MADAPAFNALPIGSTGMTAQAATWPSTSGTLNPGGPWNLRSGPNFTYTSLGKIASGASVEIVCTTNRLDTKNVSTPWHRLSTGNWVVGTVITAAGSLPNCDSPAGPKITAGVRGNDYPNASDAYADCPHDAWGFCKRQCTSFVTWRLRNVNGITTFVYNNSGTPWGNASSWASTAKKLGYRVDKTPEVGAVAQWNVASNRPVGHVAWVASVSADGQQVTIEEYNTSVKYGYSKKTINASSVDNFLHLY